MINLVIQTCLCKNAILLKFHILHNHYFLGILVLWVIGEVTVGKLYTMSGKSIKYFSNIDLVLDNL